MSTFLEDIFGPEQPTSPPVHDTPVVSADTTDRPGVATVDDADDCDWWSLLTPEQYAELTTPPQRPERCAWCRGIYRHHPDCDELHRLWQPELKFGKHKGKRIGEVPTDYLEWAVLYADGDLRRDIARELERRK